MTHPSAHMPRPMLFDTLSVLLPTEEQTWLLRACLHAGDAGSRAWHIWRELAGEPKKVLAESREGIRWLLPLLYRALQRNGAAAGRDLLPYLRTAYFREELRSRTYRRIYRNVLASLATAGIPAITLGGAALAGMVYGDWALRHCGNIDLLTREEDLPRAAAALQEADFSPLGQGLDAGERALGFEHASGLPVDLRSDLFRIPYYQAPLADIWERRRTREIAGVPAPTLAVSDMLLHGCGHASCSRDRDTLAWVCDAWHIIEQHADLDWDLFLDAALHSRLALPLSVMLSYLANDLGAPIPSLVLRRLADEGAQAPAIGREAALSGARAGDQGSLKNLLSRTDGWRARAVVLRWMLVPSPDCLRWSRSGRASRFLPLLYLRRPLRYIARRLRLARKRGMGRGTRQVGSVIRMKKPST